MGTDMAPVPPAHHRAAWGGWCPGNNERAGPRKRGRTRKGNPALRTALVAVAPAAGRAKRTSLGAHYRRLVARRGKKKATVAVAHTILVIASYLLLRQTTSQDLGSRSCDERDRQAVEHRLVHRLQGLGSKVILEPVTPAA